MITARFDQTHKVDGGSLALLIALVLTLFAGLYTVQSDSGLWSVGPGLGTFLIVNVAIFALLRRNNPGHAETYSINLMLTALIVLLLTLFPPVFLRYVTHIPAIFPDEVYYTENAFRWTSYPLLENIPRTQYELVAAIHSLIYRIWGTNIIWVRQFHMILGALSAVLIFDSARRVTEMPDTRWTRTAIALSPSLILWSVVVLKEALFIFAVSMAVNAAARATQRSGLKVAILLVCVGTVIVVALRPPFLLFAVTPFGAAVLSRRKRPLSVSILQLVCLVAVPILVSLLTGNGTNLIGFTDSIVALYGSPQALIEETNWAGNTSPLVQQFEGAAGVLQMLVAPVLLLVSPTHTAVTSFLKGIGTNQFWIGWMTASLSIGWWFVLPLLGRGIILALRSRNLFWLSVALVYFAGFLVASYARGIASIESVRAREHLLPLLLLLSAKGADFLLPGNLDPRSNTWRKLMFGYYMLLLSSALLYSWYGEVLGL